MEIERAGEACSGLVTHARVGEGCCPGPAILADSSACPAGSRNAGCFLALGTWRTNQVFTCLRGKGSCLCRGCSSFVLFLVREGSPLPRRASMGRVLQLIYCRVVRTQFKKSHSGGGWRGGEPLCSALSGNPPPLFPPHGSARGCESWQAAPACPSYVS